jgi:HK97 gp10 family phage protein
MGVIRIEGLEELQKKLKKNANMDDVKKVVRHNGSQLQQKIQQKADFKKGYQTGTTKRSVSLEFKDNGLTAESGAATEYAEYLEFGTRFMEAQPFVKPALEEQSKKFESDLQKLVK